MSGLSEAAETTLHDYLRFRLGNQWYGIDVDDVIEVLHFMTLTELPVSRPEILGMMRLREMIVTVVDLRMRFGLSDVSYTLDTPIIVANVNSKPLGLVVDDVDGLEAIGQVHIQPHDGSTSAYIMGMAHLPNDLLLLLDLSLLRTDLQIS